MVIGSDPSYSSARSANAPYIFAPLCFMKVPCLYSQTTRNSSRVFITIGTIPGHRFPDGLSGYQQEPDGDVARGDHDWSPVGSYRTKFSRPTKAFSLKVEIIGPMISWPKELRSGSKYPFPSMA